MLPPSWHFLTTLHKFMQKLCIQNRVKKISCNVLSWKNANQYRSQKPFLDAFLRTNMKNLVWQLFSWTVLERVIWQAPFYWYHFSRYFILESAKNVSFHKWNDMATVSVILFLYYSFYSRNNGKQQKHQKENNTKLRKSLQSHLIAFHLHFNRMQRGSP